MTASEPVLHRTDSGFAFYDIAYGMLFFPSQTVEMLCDENVHLCRDSVLRAAWVVMLASSISGVIQCNAAFPLVVLIAVGCVIGGLLNWVFLAWMLQLACAWLSKPRTFNRCLVLAGWTTLPLIFTAPVACFKNICGPLYLLFALVPGAWSICLLFLVFQHATAMGKMKTFLLILVGPPLFALAYIFWCFVAALTAAQICINS